MAEPQPTNDHLIEAHLAQVRASLGTRPGADEAVAELRDHLLTATERFEADGLDRATAEQRAVDGLGDAPTVAAAYATNDRGRPAVPTTTTRLGGLTAWVVTPALAWTAIAWSVGDRIEASEGWGGSSELWYSLGSVGVLVATFALLITAVAVVARHGGLGPIGWVALGVAGLGTAVSVLAWAVPVWATLLAVAWAILALAVRRQGLAPTWALVALAAGFGAMPLLVVASDTAASDRWAGVGAWAIAGPLLGLVAIAAVGAGSIGLARWLGAEVPVEAPRTAAA